MSRVFSSAWGKFSVSSNPPTLRLSKLRGADTALAKALFLFLCAYLNLVDILCRVKSKLTHKLGSALLNQIRMYSEHFYMSETHSYLLNTGEVLALC